MPHIQHIAKAFEKSMDFVCVEVVQKIIYTQICTHQSVFSQWMAVRSDCVPFVLVFSSFFSLSLFRPLARFVSVVHTFVYMMRLRICTVTFCRFSVDKCWRFSILISEYTAFGNRVHFFPRLFLVRQSCNNELYSSGGTRHTCIHTHMNLLMKVYAQALPSSASIPYLAKIGRD